MGPIGQVSSKLQRSPQRIAYIGNSVTAQRDGFRTRMQASINSWSGIRHEEVNFGLGGVGSFGSAALLEHLVLRRRPSIAFIETSLADSGLNTPAEWVEDSVRSIVGSLREINTETIFLHLPRIDKFRSHVAATRLIYDRISADQRVPQIDVERCLSDSGIELRPSMYVDGIHTTPEGGRYFASAVLTALTEGIKEPRIPMSVISSRGFTPMPLRLRTKWADSLEITDGEVTHGLFRLQLPTMRVTRNSQVTVSTEGLPVVGLIVIVDSEAGATDIKSGSLNLTVQLADEWTNRTPRLQAVVFPRSFRPRDQLSIACSPNATGDRDAAGRPSQVYAFAESLQLCGLVLAESGS